MCLCYLFSAKTAWQLVNRNADFFYKTNRFESIRITNRIESIRIANWNALVAIAMLLLLLLLLLMPRTLSSAYTVGHCATFIHQRVIERKNCTAHAYFDWHARVATRTSCCSNGSGSPHRRRRTDLSTPWGRKKEPFFFLWIKYAM